MGRLTCSTWDRRPTWDHVVRLTWPHVGPMGLVGPRGQAHVLHVGDDMRPRGPAHVLHVGPMGHVGPRGQAHVLHVVDLRLA